MYHKILSSTIYIMHIHVYMYVCGMYVCMYVCMYVHVCMVGASNFGRKLQATISDAPYKYMY